MEASTGLMPASSAVSMSCRLQKAVGGKVTRPLYHSQPGAAVQRAEP